MRITHIILLTTAFCFSQSPNILWIMAEDMNPDIGVYGSVEVLTPNLDALASEGVVYLNAFANNPVCSPSSSSIVTGMYPTSSGAHQHRTGSANPTKKSALPAPVTHFTTLLLPPRQELHVGGFLRSGESRQVHIFTEEELVLVAPV